MSLRASTLVAACDEMTTTPITSDLRYHRSESYTCLPHTHQKDVRDRR